MEVTKVTIALTAPTENAYFAEVTESFERLVGRALAVIEDDLRHQFGDVSIELVN